MVRVLDNHRTVFKSTSYPSLESALLAQLTQEPWRRNYEMLTVMSGRRYYETLTIEMKTAPCSENFILICIDILKTQKGELDIADTIKQWSRYAPNAELFGYQITQYGQRRNRALESLTC